MWHPATISLHSDLEDASGDGGGEGHDAGRHQGKVAKAAGAVASRPSLPRRAVQLSRQRRRLGLARSRLPDCRSP